MTRRVLVVADDELVLELVRVVLELQGMDVRVSRRGSHALEWLRRDSPDVVVCDIAMPGLDGGDLCRRSKGDPATAGIPVILLAADRDEDRRARQATGCDAWLTKPFSPATLLDVIASSRGEVGDGQGSSTAPAT